MKEIKTYYHGNLKEIIKSKGNLDENGNIMEGLGHIGGKKKSVCIDLYCAEDIVIEAGQFAYINLGVSMKLPEGYKSDIIPRSGTFGKYGIIQTNSDGRIDTNYSSKSDIWKMPVFSVLTQTDLKDTLKQMLIKGMSIDYTSENVMDRIVDLVDFIEFRETTIKAGERVCQMEIYEVMGDYTFIDDNLEGEVARDGFGKGTGK